MKASAMSVYGNAFTRLPAAERMAREGTTFNNAFVQMPKCVPSRYSMITGRYPHTDGRRTLTGRTDHITPHPAVTDNSMFALHEDDPNLVSLLRAEGYRTCLLGKNHLVEWNLHTKWFDQTPSWKQAKKIYEDAPQEGDRLWRADYRGRIVSTLDPNTFDDGVTATETADFFKQCAGRPFLALVDIGKPHPTYETYPHSPAASINLADIPVPPVAPLAEAPSVERCLRTSKDLEQMTDDQRRTVVRAYYSMCEFADAQIGRILDSLDAAGLAENTLVIYGADHGDFAGEHNCYEKWDTSFLECIVRVPLMMRLPGVIPAGRRIDSLVELVDIAPTLLEYQQRPVPRWMHGRSLRPLIDERVTRHRDFVFSSGGVEADALRRIRRPQRVSVKQKVLLDFPESLARAHMIRTERHKLIYRLAGEHEFYDLQADPRELTNRIDDPACAEIIAELKEKLLRFVIESEPDRPELGELIA
jgi:choline-sulfatase